MAHARQRAGTYAFRLPPLPPLPLLMRLFCEAARGGARQAPRWALQRRARAVVRPRGFAPPPAKVWAARRGARTARRAHARAAAGTRRTLPTAMVADEQHTNAERG
jgi:hypothetical protein